MTILEAAVKHHVGYYKAAEELPSRRSVINDLRKDVSYPDMLVENGIDPDHSRAATTFAVVAMPVICRHMCSAKGWWAMSRGRGARFFHESYTSDEMPYWCAYAANQRIEQRDQDDARLQAIFQLTKEQCAKHGYSFDPQYDIDGELVRVEAWRF